MQGLVFNVRFPGGGPRLPEGEQYYPWDADCWGTALIDETGVRLEGKAKVGLVGDLLTLGPAQSLLKGAVAKTLSEVIPVGDIVRVAIRKKAGKPVAAFRVHQRRDDGTIAVHTFVTGLLARKGEATSDDAVRLIRAIVPASLVVDEQDSTAPVVPAPEWYADPTGRHQLRYWDGACWTADVADAGVQSVDPLGGDG